MLHYVWYWHLNIKHHNANLTHKVRFGRLIPKYPNNSFLLEVKKKRRKFFFSLKNQKALSPWRGLRGVTGSVQTLLLTCANFAEPIECICPRMAEWPTLKTVIRSTDWVVFALLAAGLLAPVNSGITRKCWSDQLVIRPTTAQCGISMDRLTAMI